MNWELEIHLDWSEFFIGWRKHHIIVRYHGALGLVVKDRVVITICLIPCIPITIWWEDWK
jgi:hypothetical protein